MTATAELKGPQQYLTFSSRSPFPPLTSESDNNQSVKSPIDSPSDSPLPNIIMALEPMDVKNIIVWLLKLAVAALYYYAASGEPDVWTALLAAELLEGGADTFELPLGSLLLEGLAAHLEGEVERLRLVLRQLHEQRRHHLAV